MFYHPAMLMEFDKCIRLHLQLKKYHPFKQPETDIPLNELCFLLLYQLMVTLVFKLLYPVAPSQSPSFASRIAYSGLLPML